MSAFVILPYTEVISLSNETLIQLATFIVPILLGTFLGNVVSRKNSKDVNAQSLIDQIQEERDYTNKQLDKRDEKIEMQNTKIDELYDMYYTLQADNRRMAEEKKELEWELASEVKIKQRLIEENAKIVKHEQKQKEKLTKENDDLKEKISELELRVSDLEKEQARAASD